MVPESRNKKLEKKEEKTYEKMNEEKETVRR